MEMDGVIDDPIDPGPITSNNDNNKDIDNKDNKPPESIIKLDKLIGKTTKKYYQEVLVIDHKYQTIPIDEKEKPRMFALNKEDKDCLKSMNSALQLISQSQKYTDTK